MAKRRIDWLALKKEYVEGNISLRRLAQKHGVGVSYLFQRAADEHWTADRSTFRRLTVAKQTLATVTETKGTACPATNLVRSIDFSADVAEETPRERGVGWTD